MKPTPKHSTARRRVVGYAVPSIGDGDVVPVVAVIPDGVTPTEAMRALIEELSLDAGLTFEDFVADIRAADMLRTSSEDREGGAGVGGRPRTSDGSWKERTGAGLQTLALGVIIWLAVDGTKRGARARAYRGIIAGARQAARKRSLSNAMMETEAEALKQAMRPRRTARVVDPAVRGGN